MINSVVDYNSAQIERCVWKKGLDIFNQDLDDYFNIITKEASATKHGQAIFSGFMKEFVHNVQMVL